MDEIHFMHEYFRRSKPPISVQYDLREEERYIREADRLEMDETVKQRQGEQEETNKIIAELEREKREKFLFESHRRRLLKTEPELRDLQHYLLTARNTKQLVAQLQSEDAEIDQHVELVKKQATEIRTGQRLYEGFQKKLEEDQRRKRHLYGLELMSQMEDNNARRMEMMEERIRDGIELKKRIDLLNDKQRQEREDAIIMKEKLRKDTLEYLRQKVELKRQEKRDDSEAVLKHYEMERQREAVIQSIVDARNQRIQNQLDMGTKVGEKVYAINHAKEQAIAHLIEWQEIERKNREDLSYEEKEAKANENRRKIQQSMAIQMEQKETRKKHDMLLTADLMLKRLSSSHAESEMNLLRKRIERERRENENFLKARSLELEERKAGEIGQNAIGYGGEQELKRQREVEALRFRILEEQPMSLLKYLPSSLLRCNYLPQPLCNQVKEEVRQDPPIPLFSIKRNLRHVRRMRMEADITKCYKSCNIPNRISNVF